MSNTLHENKNYKVVVGNSKTFDKDAYLIVNKLTDVVEWEESVLVRAYTIADELEKQIRDWEFSNKKKPIDVTQDDNVTLIKH